ncbi:MAG: GH92 family glycosyl hydrolase, partial [Bacteroidota bacterium]|nr:GH92 family glycosyl hydrolase [Bacteroidota bacterium]
YYSVFLEDPQVKVELTTSPRTGFHRYIFREVKNPTIVFDLGFSINWDQAIEASLRVHEDGLITGYRRSKGWARDQIVYFAAMFDQPVMAYDLIESGMNSDMQEVKDKVVQGIFQFSADTIQLKVGLSSASIDGAIRSLKEEIPHWSFNEVKMKTQKRWEKELSKFKIQTSNYEDKVIFYTSFYHTMMAPALFSDLNGEYHGQEGKVNSIKARKQYTIFSLWDTFRAAHPLYTLVFPELVPDLINSILSFYKESGLLPVWELMGNETNTMIGYHSIPVIVDAFMKGFVDFDPEIAFQAMKKSAMQDREGLIYYRDMGYIPADLENESVSKALEYAFDDWCIAAMANKLGKKEEFEIFSLRAKNYRYHFDRETGFMRGKLKNGEWKEPFDPLYSEHRFDEYTEGNAWQYSWFVPHDVSGLISLMDGNEKFIAKLDSLFDHKEEVHGELASSDISGLIGQYAHGNEPSHHIAYLYSYAGAPWKTQAIVRKILDELYSAGTDGLSGNEDCGQMSAWYIMSSIGFYPVNPAQGIYVLGSPKFDEVIINTASGEEFKISVLNNNSKNIYIQAAFLNGEELKRSYITHKELLNGGELKIEMGKEPNKKLWSMQESVPPSSFDLFIF